MSLLGLLSQFIFRQANEIDNNSQLKKLVLNAPETVVGKFFSDKENKIVHRKQTAVIIGSKKKIELEYDLYSIALTLSDIQIETGYDEETNSPFEIVRCLGFFDTGIGEAISVDAENDIDGYHKKAWLYKNNAFNYASMTIDTLGDPGDIYIATYENLLLITIVLGGDYFNFIREQFYRNKLCSISIKLGLYRDKSFNMYYVRDLTLARKNEVNFTFHPSQPALKFNKTQIDNILTF